MDDSKRTAIVGCSVQQEPQIVVAGGEHHAEAVGTAVDLVGNGCFLC
ncbi:MAG: hypothetical protein JW759_03415 [Candidatus Coatesbacteria bacterium]|nr:hypothetical protein [Candidatus Coatesbacteria bacterium]